MGTMGTDYFPLACGCCMRMEQDALGTRYDSVYCRLHAQAPAMRDEWLALLTEWEASPTDTARKARMLDAWAAKARAILAAIEGT